ncbi:MAG: SHOCT domain-containing protein [Candidatus Binatia bacterium]
MRPYALVTPLLLLVSLITVAGCAVRRTHGPGKPIGNYDYAVLSEQTSHEYFRTASQALDRSFVVLDEHDRRLESPSVRLKACTVAVDWAPGFWSTSGWVEVKDYAHGTPVLTSHMRRGMLWIGAHADVMEAIQDVAAARAAGPELPPDARDPGQIEAQPENLTRSAAQRLEELNNLRARGLISDAEYSAQRKNIIQQQ